MHPIAGDGLLTIKTRAVYSYHPTAGDYLLTRETRAVSICIPLLVMVYKPANQSSVHMHPIVGDGLLTKKSEQCPATIYHPIAGDGLLYTCRTRAMSCPATIPLLVMVY
jgi:hypothetical protein